MTVKEQSGGRNAHHTQPTPRAGLGETTTLVTLAPTLTLPYHGTPK